MKIIELAFCCYAVTDMKRAREFYEGVLNGPYVLALGCAPGFKPSPDGCSAALEVEDFDAAVSQLKQHDVKFRIEPMDCPGCRMAMVFDPDGNTICIHKRKKS